MKNNKISFYVFLVYVITFSETNKTILKYKLIFSLKFEHRAFKI